MSDYAERCIYFRPAMAFNEDIHQPGAPKMNESDRKNAIDLECGGVRHEIAKSLTNAVRIIADEVADESAMLAQILKRAAAASVTMPHWKATQDVGAYILEVLQELIVDRAERIVDGEKR